MTDTNPLLRYKIRSKIGAGGMATVYLAFDKVLERDVAIKMIHPHLLNHKESMKRFTNEAKAIATLSNDHIIKVFDYGENKNRPFIVMEYVKGSTLQDILENHSPLPNLVILHIARQILLALQAAHSKGIYHRDIKPSNILITPDGDVKLTDFGIAFIVNTESITLSNSFLGSPQFISPEQASGMPITAATDIFSLGVLLYLCSTGTFPFTSDTPHGIINTIINNNPEPILTLNSKILFWIADLIDMCLAKDPENRGDCSKYLKFIKDKCSSDQITSSSSVISDYLLNPAGFTEKEHADFFTNFRTLAITEYKKKQTITALRRLEQARRFGTLSLNETRIMSRIKTVSFHRKFIPIALVVAAAVVIPLIFWSRFIFGSNQADIVKHEKEPGTIPIQKNKESIVFSKETVFTHSIVAQSGKMVDTNTIAQDTLTTDSNLTYTSQTKVQQKKSERVFTPLNSTPVEIRQAIADTGILFIQTNPPWVSVFIDSLEKGMTPAFKSTRLSSGTHILELKKNGFKTYSDTFTINPIDTVTLRIKLEPSPPENALHDK
jgi:serine/threonine protein kinase